MRGATSLDVMCVRDLACELETALLAAGIASVRRDVPLAPITRWKIGGPADLLIEPETTEQVAAAMKLIDKAGAARFVLGDGSNMLMDSAGFRGAIIHIGSRMGWMKRDGTHVNCGAGLWVPLMAMRLARAGLAGLEHVVGIPGTLGGLVLMNGGSQRKGVGTHVARVTFVTATGDIRCVSHDELGYAYRHSALQGAGGVITEVDLELEKGSVRTIRREMIDIMAARRKKFPKNLPNCGSTFLSNPAMYDTVGPPGKAIEEAGLKGRAIGGAQISPLHANFIVNRGGATSDDVLALIAFIRGEVHRRTGYRMDCEARHVTQWGEERPAHEFTDAGRFDPSLLHSVSLPADA